MKEVREENTRLKLLLEQIEKDYKSLQMRFIDIFQQKSNKKSSPSTTDEDRRVETEPELVSLRLGMSSNKFKKNDTTPVSTSKRRDGELKDGLQLGLDCNFGGLVSDSSTEVIVEASPENSSEEMKREKVVKRGGEDEASEGSSVKRARVSVRARCDTPTVSTFFKILL